MRSILATSVVVTALSAGGALAQTEEISLGWYEDNWEATTFPIGDGTWDCSVDSLADNFADRDGAWVFVFPTYLQFSPNAGVPYNGGGQISVDGSAPFPMIIYEDQAGFVADEDDLPLLQAIAHGQEMLVEVWPANAGPGAAQEYVYSLDGFREAYLHIASECQFDPSLILDGPEPEPAPSADGGGSLFGRDKH